MKCPYCETKFFEGSTWDSIHSHVIECSKEYIDDKLFNSKLLKEYIEAEILRYVGGRPVHVHYKIDRRSNNSTRRGRIGDRRQDFNTLYILGKEFGVMTHAGYYLNASGCVERDRRDAKGLGRRNGPQRRKS